MEIINNIEEIYNEVLLDSFIKNNNNFKCLFCNQILNKKNINHIKLCIKTNKILLSENEIETIIHISDIHIRKSTRFEEYRDVFNLCGCLGKLKYKKEKFKNEKGIEIEFDSWTRVEDGSCPNFDDKELIVGYCINCKGVFLKDETLPTGVWVGVPVGTKVCVTVAVVVTVGLEEGDWEWVWELLLLAVAVFGTPV
jgi:hypothetical protein